MDRKEKKKVGTIKQQATGIKVYKKVLEGYEETALSLVSKMSTKIGAGEIITGQGNHLDQSLEP